MCIQAGTNLQDVLHEKAFSQPRLVIFLIDADAKDGQGFVIAKKTILFQIDNFSVCEGTVSLIQ